MLLIWTDPMDAGLLQQLEIEGHQCVVADRNSTIHAVIPDYTPWVLITNNEYLHDKWSKVAAGEWLNASWHHKRNVASVLIPDDAWEALKR